jgi:hypothetical protein
MRAGQAIQRTPVTFTLVAIALLCVLAALSTF